MKLKLLLSCGVVLSATVLALMPFAATAAVVTCEPQGTTPHPPTYFYDVDPQNNFT